MRVKEYIRLQFDGIKITVYKGHGLSSPILYQGNNKDLKDEDILNMEVHLVSGAADQECGIRFFV